MLSTRDAELSLQHKFGNFRSYYAFHPADSRLVLLPAGHFLTAWERAGAKTSFRLLDVGCNEGDLSLSLYVRARNELPLHVRLVVLGIDIDPVLIERAKGKVIGVQSGEQDIISFAAADAMSEEQVSRALAGLGEPTAPLRFDFASIFSVTMWIHINNGTEGLLHFLDYVSQLVSPTGSLLLEIQGAKSYKTAAKRLRKLGVAPPPFKIERELIDSIESRLVEHLQVSPLCGLGIEKRLGHESWQDRPVYLFSKCAAPDVEITCGLG